MEESDCCWKMGVRRLIGEALVADEVEVRRREGGESGGERELVGGWAAHNRGDGMRGDELG